MVLGKKLDVMNMSNEPDPQVIAKLRFEEALAPSLRALYARRDQLDILIALIRAEQALSGYAVPEKKRG